MKQKSNKDNRKSDVSRRQFLGVGGAVVPDPVEPRADGRGRARRDRPVHVLRGGALGDLSGAAAAGGRRPGAGPGTGGTRRPVRASRQRPRPGRGRRWPRPPEPRSPRLRGTSATGSCGTTASVRWAAPGTTWRCRWSGRAGGSGGWGIRAPSPRSGEGVPDGDGPRGRRARRR